MDRNREARRGVSMAASNGLSRRRHRSSSLRDSPDEDGPLELQETARLRDRKKDRDRDRDRERDRDRDRERERDRERDRLSRSSKRRRSDKFMHGTNREDGGDDSSDDSMNDDDEDEDDDGGAAGNSSSMRMLPPNPPSSSSSLLNHHHHHNNSNNSNNHHSSNHSRKSFPPQPKVFRASPTVAASAAWKAADEMIGVSVPRKARSASTKRSHECWSSSAAVLGGGESIHRQASTSPVRPSIAAVLATPAPPPASPSSSNASVRKKMKPSGPKPRPPKSSSNKSSSSAQEEIEIEIAEVLYGLMRQPQGPSKQEIIVADSNSRETNNNNINNKSASDAKSRVSSPISNSPSTLPQTSSILPTNSGSSNAPMSAIAPKRKKPRPVKYEDENSSAFTVRNSPISSAPKAEMDQSVKTDTCSPILEKTGSAAAENGSVSYDLMSSEPSEQQPEPDTLKPERNAAPLTDSKCAPAESSGGGDVGVTKEEPQSPKKESTVGLRLDDDRRENSTLTKANSTTSEIENQREEKFQIDLMAPPPQRSSPERDDFVRVDLQPEMKPGVKDDAIAVKTVKEDASVEAEVKKVKTTVEESESQKPVVNKERNVDLQLDLEKTDKDSGTGSLTGNKMNQHVQKQHHQPPPPVPEKTGQSNSLPLPLPMAGWPGGLPPMGYMAPLQGVVSVDGSAVSPAAIQPPHLLFSQPRPKRCATHFYIARNIHFHQQFTRMNQFWPPPPGSASIYGAKTSNLNIVPPTEMHGSIPVRGVNSVQDKGQGLAIFPGHTGKDNKGSQPAAVVDAAQRKQILLQQALPPGAPNNILHAPAFIFPLSQQQAAAAASVRSGSVKSPPATGSSASSNASNSASVSANAPVGASAAALGFNYPNIPGNETQYLAILQNNAYPFPISHVGAPPAYRGAHPQAMPFFNSSFYSSQMLHPSQLQQQQQQQQQQPLPLPTQSQQSQGHPNPSVSSGSSSSQKHLQNQQQRPHNNGINGGSGTLQGFPAPKNQPQQLHGQRQQQNQQVPHQARQLETDMVGEESPSTADSRVSRANMNIYNLAMPLHPPNFPLMTSASMGGATSASGSHGEKKSQQQQQPQLQGSKAGVETLNPQTFAMSFAISGAPAPGQDISSIAQNPAILQSLPEAMRHGYQIMAAAAQAAQQKKNYRGVEEGKSGSNDASNVEEERKSMAGKPPATVGQSIAFNRPDLTDTPASTMMGNAVIDSSARTLNIGFMPPRTSVMPPIGSVNPSTAPQQMQWNQQQQQQQIIQLHKQQQFAAGGRSKTPATSNGNAYTDHLPSSSMAAKFPNALSSFPQNLVQSGGNPAQSHQWKNSGRTSTAQVTSPSLSSTTSSVKNLPQQQGRTQQNHNQISFAAKSSSAAQGQQPPSNNQSPPPMVVGSPTTSSISKTSTGGSPRTTTATSTGNKSGQASSLSSQQAKNSASIPSRKSSPVTSILGNPTITSSSTVAKPQTPQLQQQQQLFQKQAMQQAQLLFSNAAYMQAQAQHVGSTTSSATPASGFFIQRHRDQQQPQKHQGASASSSSGMLSLCPPVTHSNTGTSDPAQAVAAAAASNMKGGGLTSQGLIHSVQFATAQSSGKPHQLVPAGFQYVHPVPAAVQVKPSEQKQPAGE